MQNFVFIAKILVGSAKKEEFVVDTLDVEVMRICNTTNVLLKYNWHLDSTDNKAAIDLGLRNVKIY